MCIKETLYCHPTVPLKKNNICTNFLPTLTVILLTERLHFEERYKVNNQLYHLIV